MQPFLLTLLIGTAFAMVNAAPSQNKLQRLQAVLENDDAEVQRFGKHIASFLGNAVGGLAGGLLSGGGEGAKLQDDAEVQRFGKHLSSFLGNAVGSLTGSLIGGGGEERVKLQDEDDDDDDMAKAQFIGHIVKSLLG